MADKKPREIENQEQLKSENISEDKISEVNAQTVTTARSPQERKNKIIKNIKYWVVLNIGILLLSLGVYMFEDPNGFLMGGVSGISIFLANVVTPLVPWLTYNVFILIINAVLLIVGFIFLGKDVGLKTVYCTVMYTLEINLLSWIHPMGGIPITAVLNGAGEYVSMELLEAIYAVLIAGIAQAIIFYCGATSGGTDIIALIVKKYKKINISFAIIAVDFVIATLAFFPVFAPNFGWKMGLLCILAVALRAFAIDGIIENIAKTKYVTIITSNPEIAADVIINDLDRSYTKYKAEGGYTGDERTIIITVCQRAQAIRLKEKLQNEDPTAFTIITDANEIIGDGFAAKF